MGEIAIPLMVASTVLQGSQQVRAGEAALAQGKAVQQARAAEAAQLEQQAGTKRALSQREAIAERKKEALVQSAIQARAAASGGGAADPGIVDLAEDIAGEGEYRFRSAMFSGEEAGRGMEYGAVLRRFEGDDAYRAGQIARKSGNMAALSTIIGGGANYALYEKYGSGSRRPTLPPST
jgi:hypothetical protein